MNEEKLNNCIDNLYKGISPTSIEIEEIINTVLPIFNLEPNVLRLDMSIYICGDSHGQLYDIIHLFELYGEPNKSNYIFLGDYVDRGYYSVELICLLLCYKIKYPLNIYLLRGNHETNSVNSEYGFLDEINAKYLNSNLFELFNNLFKYLPISAIIDSRIFCVHGGISPQLQFISQIDELDRKVEPDYESLLSHLLWSDPFEVDEWKRSSRRSGYLFNENHCKEFLNNNNLKMIVRSHEMVDGYKLMFNNLLATVWCAPNYCYLCGNLGSVLFINIINKNDEFLIFDQMPLNKTKKPSQSLLNQYY